MKRIILLVVITSIFLCNVAIAQDSIQVSNKEKLFKNSIHASIGPGGLLFLYIPALIYYERIIQRDLLGPKITPFIDAGIGFASDYDNGESSFLLARFGILTGKKKHHFETSAGVAYFHRDAFLGASPSLSIGYRSQKPQSHYVFRTGVGWPEAIYVSWGVSF